MAALLTSVIDNSGKVSEYIVTCRSMGIEILPPDINEGESGFSVSGNSIRYALTAIKSVGRPVIDAVVGERRANGRYTNLKDFISRVADKEVNKRAVENFIKAGAMDSLGGTRKQHMSVYMQIMDSVQQERKNNLAGQLSLFDIAAQEDKEDYEMKLPNVGEYEKEMKLAFEKEVLGIYISGHPLEEYQDLWRKNITNTTSDFLLDEETGAAAVEDGKTVTVGGMITEKKIKYTKNEKVMAFLQLEDLVGSIEVIVFPRDYEKYSSYLAEDGKVFIRGRVSLEEEKDGKLVCEKITPFDEIPKKLWIKLPSKEAYEEQKEKLFGILKESEGNDSVVIYVENPRAMNPLGPNWNVNANPELIERLEEVFGKGNVKVV
jgi:DNA polymerase-3 subunit alpha